MIHLYLLNYYLYLLLHFDVLLSLIAAGKPTAVLNEQNAVSNASTTTDTLVNTLQCLHKLV